MTFREELIGIKSDLQYAPDIDKLRAESGGQTRILWASAWWDGPIEGAVLWNGETCWFKECDTRYTYIQLSQTVMDALRKMDEEDGREYDPEEIDNNWDMGWYRVYNVYRLPDNVRRDMLHNHRLHVLMYGNGYDFDMEGRREFSKSKEACTPVPKRKWYEWFMRKRPMKLELEKYPVIGQFE